MKKNTFILALSMLCFMTKATDIILPINYQTIFADSATLAPDPLTGELFLERDRGAYNGIGRWIMGNNSSTLPLNPTVNSTNSLSYLDYVDNLQGREIVWTPQNFANTRYSGFPFYSTAITTGTFYASALVKIDFTSYDPYPIMSFDKTALSAPRARVFVKSGTTDSTYVVAMSTNSLTTISSYSTTEYVYGKTYLYIIKYVTSAAGEDGYLYINPPLDQPEPATATLTGLHVAGATGGCKAFEIMTQKELDGKISGIRIATRWDYVAKGGGITKLTEIPTNKDYVTVNGKNLIISETGNVDIFTLQGTHILSLQNTDNVKTNFATGVYIVHFRNQVGELSIRKVIIR